ncbi:MAG TPA: NrfD/PsrC family molybdoenzyme membrane anchor subunit, partial [Ktedonobacterales bacterium]|nr:NrfD/PsrC family molybdoenzyme membrane anchor subunit [Ktedonobacterales bacterium]
MELYDRPPSELSLPALRPAEQRPATYDERKTYYDHPMVKVPKWRWYIPGYFWLGGIAGGAAMIGAVAHFLGGRGGRETARHARYLSFVLAIICPVLLILDLHRPERFLRMFRVFKLSSPLSVGTWFLTAFGAVSGALALRQAADDDVIIRRKSALGRLARRFIPAGPLSVLHGLFGLGLGGYTGVLIAVTAVPLWAAGGVLLGPLFLATALASGAAALILLALAFGKHEPDSMHIRESIEVVETVGAVSQLALVAAREAVVTKRINQPLRRGRWGLIYRAGAVGGGMVTPLALRLAARFLGPRAARTLSAVAATLNLLGALAERFAIIEAGKVSAADPLAYQDLTAGTPGEAR